MSNRGDNSRPEGAAVIERIEQALRERLAAVDPPAAVPPGSAAPGSEDSTRGYIPKERFGTECSPGWSLRNPGNARDAGGYEHIEAAVARAEQRSREAAALIEEVTAALAAWRERAAQLRQRLAEWPTRAL